MGITELAGKQPEAATDAEQESVTTGIKFKLILGEEEKRRINEYFDEYAKAVTFAARVVSKLRKPIRFAGKKVGGKWVFEKGRCALCGQDREISHTDLRDGNKLCKECHKREYGDSAIRKKMVPATIGKRTGERIDSRLNLHNATTKISKSHMHYAVNEAIQLLWAVSGQRKAMRRRYLRDRANLKRFGEMISDPSKRVEIPARKRQRKPWFVHVSQKDKIGRLRGYTIRGLERKVRVLERNLKRDRRTLARKTPVAFGGWRILLAPPVKFDVGNNRVRFTLRRAGWYRFYGTNVASERGREFFAEKLRLISEQKPRYAYLIRKKIGEREGKPEFEYYLQYAVGINVEPIGEYAGVLGVDRGIKKLAVVVFIPCGKTKPEFVKFFRGNEITRIKIARRKQKYALTGVRHKREKVKRLRPISDKINYVLHSVSKEIVGLAKKHRAAIAMEALEKMKKGRIKQRARERYFLSLNDYNKLSQLISYKAAKEGYAVLEVPPAGTSYTCSHCLVQGRNVTTNTVRPYKNVYSLIKCKECGVELNSDYNAAFNIAWEGLKLLKNNI